jgi:hypothetical protein
MKLKSAEQEAKDCQKAFKGFKVGGHVVHCHHEELEEVLIESFQNRINYILKEKPKKEQALRLRLFRPVTGQALAEYEKVPGQAWAEYEKVTGQALAEYEKVTGQALAEAEYEKVTRQAWAEYEKVTGQAHKLICKIKDCPWNGKSIF